MSKTVNKEKEIKVLWMVQQANGKLGFSECSFLNELTFKNHLIDQGYKKKEISDKEIQHYVYEKVYVDDATNYIFEYMIWKGKEQVR